MSAAGDLRPGDVVADRYVVEARLGQSPAASSYLADENHSRQKLILKVYRPEIAASALSILSDFILRAGAWPALNHDNLAAIYDVQEWEGRVFLAREFLEGPDFGEWASNPQVSPAKGLESIWQAAQGLAFLHENALHLNVHPGNVLVGGFTAKLSDPDPRFLTTSDLIPQPLPVPPQYRGYVAPEMRRGGSLAFPATDLYGLAGLLFLLLTGSHPTENPSDLRRRLGAGMPREAADFLAKTLHPDPEQRYPDAATFADALWALQPFLPARSEPTPASGTLFGQTTSPLRKTEIMPPAVSASATLFGDPPEAAFVEPKAVTPSKPSVRAPLSSLESPPEVGSTLFGGAALAPEPVKRHKPAPTPPLTALSGNHTLFPAAPKAPPVPPLRPSAAMPSPSPRAAASLSSLEMDSADLTLSGAGSRE